MRRLLTPELGLEQVFLLTQVMFNVTQSEWDQMWVGDSLELSSVVKQRCPDVRVRNNHDALLEKKVD